MKTPTDRPRRCFTRTCTNPAEPGMWECAECQRRIHAASERATERARQAKRLAKQTGTKTGDEVPA